MPAPAVTGPMDKFVVRTPADPNTVKPKARASSTDTEDDEEEAEPPLSYAWKEIVSSSALAVISTELNEAG